MVAGYRCGTQRRRAAVRGSATLNGIDYLVVGADETTLEVHFLNGLPGTANPVPPGPAPALSASNVAVDGGVRYTGIGATNVTVADEVLTVTVDRPGWQVGDAIGDYSTYTLRLRRSELDDRPPAGFDPQLCDIEFSFKAGCETDFDCGLEDRCPPDVFPQPDIDYLAKDYASFRQLMLDRMALTMPAWRERNPADVEVALVELLAYVGDHLSYFQDAVATEQYLGTALKRPSIRRHARLLDYRMHEGCNARAWVCFEMEDAGADGTILPPSSRVLSSGPEGSPRVVDPDPANLGKVIEEQRSVVFETVTPVALRFAHNEIPFHTWDEDGCCLPAGATTATLVAAGVTLAPGDRLLFEEVLGPVTGVAADADPTHRWAVRMTEVTPGQDQVTGTAILDVAWGMEDALPFALCISAQSQDGLVLFEDVSVARGNVALADHGMTVPLDPSGSSVGPEPPIVPDEGPYRPVLLRAPLTFAAPAWPSDRPATQTTVARFEPAASAMATDPSEAVPAVTELTGGGLSWNPRLDLLDSDRFEPDFVVEMDEDGTAHLRFGDDELGLAPVSASRFRATYRVGNGRAGNVGAHALARVAPPADIYATLSGKMRRVWNPVPATGGVDPEPIERVKLLAPQAFRRQERAVTETDYATVTERMPRVQRAAATLRWTGSWYTAFVTADRTAVAAASKDEAAFESGVRTWLDLFRMAGTDVEIDPPLPMPLDLALQVCAAADFFPADVERALLDALGSRVLPDGTRGFFHPDNFTFGQPVYLSQVYAAALAVPGVSSVTATRFKRWGKEPNQELENTVIMAGRLEIARLDNDPSFPENGRLELAMAGGR